MILQLLDKEKRCQAVFLENGRETVYDVDFYICASPVCLCNTVEMTLTPVSADPETGMRGPARVVNVDVVARKLADGEEVKKRGPERDFADNLLRQMDGDDFQFLLRQYLAYKQIRTDEADPEEIDAIFEYDQIDKEGVLTAYKDILPYSDPFLVTLNGEPCVVLDQYCLKRGCSCTDVCLNVFRIEPDCTAVGRELGSYFVDYRREKWRTADAPEGNRDWIDLATVRQAITDQLPSFYAQMKKRHRRLARIYDHCRDKAGGTALPVRGQEKIGRNDPCPCGSGRKYKKCCLGKQAAPEPGSGLCDELPL
jgi:hypothetical protein